MNDQTEWAAVENFHERALVAPLKHGGIGEHAPDIFDFHERALVAPLKPVVVSYPLASTCISTSARSWPH